MSPGGYSALWGHSRGGRDARARGFPALGESVKAKEPMGSLSLGLSVFRCDIGDGGEMRVMVKTA